MAGVCSKFRLVTYFLYAFRFIHDMQRVCCGAQLNIF